MLYMCGVDCSSAPAETREKLALSKADVNALARIAKKTSGINGCLPLSTCNRTEVYISCSENADKNAIFERVFGGSENCIKLYAGEDVIRHFFETACGLNSLIKRETQIITQISDAEKTAREAGCLDAELEVLSRLALTTAKKAAGVVSDDIRLSSAHLAADWFEEKNGGLKGAKCLVVGNGNVGRLAAQILHERGADVTMTLRSRKTSVVPRGCRAIPYEERYGFGADILVSATKSPHFTFTEDRIKFPPKYIADLALPRDISPELREKYGGNYRCIDDFAAGSEDVSQVYDEIENGINEYYLWANYRNAIPVMDEIKDMITKRLCAANGFDTEEIRDVVVKTADMLLCGMKETVNPESMQKCLEKLAGRARL